MAGSWRAYGKPAPKLVRNRVPARAWDAFGFSQILLTLSKLVLAHKENTMNNKQLIPLFVMAVAALEGCDETVQQTENPLLAAYDTPFGVPPFNEIDDADFKPAYEVAIARHGAEIDSIAGNPETPTFDNTILALENAGQLLTRVSTVFNNLNSANTNDNIQILAKELAPLLSAHRDDIMLNKVLFERVKAVWEGRDAFVLSEEQQQLLEKTFRNFVRSGANLSDRDKDRLRNINAELAVLTLQFGQNLLAETNAYTLVIDDEKDLSGLPKAVRAAAADAAAEKGMKGKWVFTLANPSVMPFLQYADNRELRKQIWEAYKNRGDRGNANDNKEILVKIANLRLLKANLLGYPTHAHYVLEEAMAKTPDNVFALLGNIWGPALDKAKEEAAAIRQEIAATGESFAPAPYDWRYYAEKIRLKRYAIDEDALKPYFSLGQVRQGAFDVANKLYGLTFKSLNGIPVYHEDVEVYQVADADGSHLGILYMDFFPRPSKRSGAWMTSYRKQKMSDGERIPPIISVVCNFTKPVGEQPALLTFEEASTLFHEFGHALHGLLSNVTYESLSGTAVPRDFVEMPSQIMESWAAHPDVLKSYARHYETGEPIPDELVAKLGRAATFNQGFATVEYLAAAYLDMDYHTRTEAIDTDANAVERASMQRIGLIDEIIPRYRSTYFQHIFSGGYSAGYNSYIWADVLAADAFAAFEETSLFDPATAAAFRANILETGGTEKPDVLYRNFRKADPNPVHLMRKRGLD